jgi:hypothetical protein
MYISLRLQLQSRICREKQWQRLSLEPGVKHVELCGQSPYIRDGRPVDRQTVPYSARTRPFHYLDVCSRIWAARTWDLVGTKYAEMGPDVRRISVAVCWGVRVDGPRTRAVSEASGSQPEVARSDRDSRPSRSATKQLCRRGARV